MKKIIIISIVVAFILVAGAMWSKSLKSGKLSQEITGVEQFVREDRFHVDGEVEYERIPPVGGNHANVWAACNGNIYSETIPEEQAMHSLEHGAVWVTYQPSMEESQITALRSKVRGYTFMSPLAEQASPIILTAWGTQLSLQSVDDTRLDQFLAKFRQGPQTPEPGATCNAVPGGIR